VKLKKIFISAGEVSGDVHGARLVNEIRKADPSIEFTGICSEKMAAAGVKLYADLTKKSTIGFIEPLIYIPGLFLTFLKMKKLIGKDKPDLVIAIDNQGFNMVFLAAVKKLKIPAVYYISPQEWQWGTDKGGKAVTGITDKILAIFREEAEFYNRLGGNAVYIGNPILDIARPEINKDNFKKLYKIGDKKKILAVFPGSRMQEIRHSFPVLLASAVNISKSVSDIEIIISVTKPYFLKKIKRLVKKYNTGMTLYSGNNYDLISNSDLSLTKSGTITLEHAVLGTPFIAGYRLGKISYMVIKKIMEKKWHKISFISLPNIYLGRMAYPEFIQDDFNTGNVTYEAVRILTDEKRRSELKAASGEVRKLLGEPGVVKRAAAEILSMLAVTDRY